MNNEYILRINKAIDFIDRNIQQPFSLDELAQVACFSKFHFTRIFYSFTNETPFQFISRIRLEKAAFLMVSNPNIEISEIAANYGFSDLSVFSRNFKKNFQMSPTQYRKLKKELRNISQTESNNHQTGHSIDGYFCPDTNLINRREKMELNKSVEVKEFPLMHVAYLRHIGPYQGDEGLFERLWNELFAWAGPRGLLQANDLKSIVIYHDDPNLTDDSKLRMSLCITVPEATKVDGKIGKMEIDAGKYAVARFELTAQDFGAAWQWVYGEWLPSSGYQPDDKPPFELYPEEPKDGKFVVDICVPVKPM